MYTHVHAHTLALLSVYLRRAASCMSLCACEVAPLGVSSGAEGTQRIYIYIYICICIYVCIYIYIYSCLF